MKQPNVILVAYCLFVPLLFLYFTRSFSNCPNPAVGLGWCTTYEFIKDFKDVFGWLVAFYVAYVASRPVWKQLDLMRDDVAISSIKYLEQEIEALKRIRSDADVALQRLVLYIQNCCRIDDGYVWTGDAHAAHHAESLASTALSRIRELSMPFGKAVDEPFSCLLSAVSNLETCFYEMVLSVYIDGDPEISIDDHEIAETERRAAQEIDSRISNLHAAKSDFDAGIASAVSDRIARISQRKGEMFAAR